MANKLFDRLVEDSGSAAGNTRLTKDLDPCDLPFATPIDKQRRPARAVGHRAIVPQ